MGLACADDGGAAAGETGSSGSGASEDASTTGSSGSTTGSTTGGESTGDAPMGYDDPALWLCHPDKPPGEDQCLANDLTATELLPDGTTRTVTHEAADDPAYDCFYVYPTVDLRLAPGQTEDFVDISQELDPLLSQAARLTSHCRMFAPLYHQVTIGTFQSGQLDDLLDAAYQDVLAAFESYLANHAGDRDLVIMGHSQGTFMTTRLVQEVIEPDPDLRARLIVALLIGGSVSVPHGETVGGTFDTIPLCTSADEVGCTIAYRTYAADHPPAAGNQVPDIAGNDIACTNPAELGRGPTRFAGVFLPTQVHQEIAFGGFDFGMPIDTPFVLYRDYFAGECLVDGDGLSFLGITIDAAAQDMRANPIDFADPLFSPTFLGLHVLDYNFAMQNLVDLVAAKAAAKGL
jgi:hypothetical protein